MILGINIILNFYDFYYFLIEWLNAK